MRNVGYNGDYLVNRVGLVINLQGDTILSLATDQFNYFFGYRNTIAWSKNNLVAIAGQKLGVIDANNKTLVYENDTTIRGMGISWFPDNKRIVWIDQIKGIHITNIQTGKTVQLRKNCLNRRYYSPNVSPNGKYIVCEREDIAIKSICVMKINGKDEQIIKLK